MNFVTTRTIFLTGTFFINLCSFLTIGYIQGNGGVLYALNIKMNISIYNSNFYQCYANGNGGAIYFNCNSLSYFDFKQICSSICLITSSKTGFFINLISTNLDNLLFNYSTINKCAPNSTYLNIEQSMVFIIGNMNLNYCNSSNNYAKRESTMAFIISNGIFNFNNFFNNSAAFISISFNGILNYLNNSNIIQCNSPNNYGILHSGSGNPSDNTINNCIFYNNQNTLFYRLGGTLRVYNCYINHSYNIYGGSIITSNNYLILTSSYLILTFQCLNKIYSTQKNLNLMIFFKTYLIINL